MDKSKIEEARNLMRRMPAGEFKAKCLAVIDEVALTGEPVLVTKRGKPAAKLVPPDAVTKEDNPEAIFGVLRGMIDPSSDLDSLTAPIVPEDEWSRLNENWSAVPQDPRE